MQHSLESLRRDSSSALCIGTFRHALSTPALLQVPGPDTLRRKLKLTRSATDLDEPLNGFVRQRLMDSGHDNSHRRLRQGSRWVMALGPSTSRAVPCPIFGLGISPLGEPTVPKHIKYALQIAFLILSFATVSYAQTPQAPHVFIVLETLGSTVPTPLSPSGPITIAGRNGRVVENLHITNANGDCIVVTDSTNIIIRRSEIGPCGGHGVKISGGNTIGIYDNYIHPEKPLRTGCCDTHDGVFAKGTSNLSIQGNVIAYGESNIEVDNVTAVNVTGNFLLNPIDSDPSQPAHGQSRGQNFQAWNNSRQVTVQNNYALSSTDTSKYLFAENQEDSINIGLTDGIVVRENYITGGHSRSGCGLIADDRANSAQFLSNTLSDTGQCGIAIAAGTNQIVDSNRVLNRTPVRGGGNTAIYVWKQYAAACGPVKVSNNIAAEIKLDGSQSGFWNGGGCDPVTLKNNTFDAAAQALLCSVNQPMTPPQIPPYPKDCVVASPFTNNTHLSPCGAD